MQANWDSLLPRSFIKKQLQLHIVALAICFSPQSIICLSSHLLSSLPFPVLLPASALSLFGSFYLWPTGQAKRCAGNCNCNYHWVMPKRGSKQANRWTDDQERAGEVRATAGVVAGDSNIDGSMPAWLLRWMLLNLALMAKCSFVIIDRCRTFAILIGGLHKMSCTPGYDLDGYPGQSGEGRTALIRLHLSGQSKLLPDCALQLMR